MDNSKAYGIRRAAVLYSALYLIIFLIFYLPNYAFADYFLELSDGALNAFLIFRDGCERLVQFFVPMSAATVLLLHSARHGIRNIFVPSLGAAATSLVYALPYCYLYALSLGYDSAEGLLISILLSAIGALLLAVAIVVLTLVARVIAGFTVGAGLNGTREERRLYVHGALDEALVCDGVFDLSSPLTRSIFGVGFAIFATQAVSEIISVVIYLTEDGAYFETRDIVEITYTFVFMLLELLGCHAACFFIAKKLKKSGS